MITGFNTNVRYGDKLFHVQTEDSGRQRPHVISHVYHGGTILCSEKNNYEDLLDSENLAAEVRALMEGQHRKLLARLQAGELDQLIAERLGEAPTQDTSPTAEVVAQAQSPSPREVSPPQRPRAFGEGVVSKKPLDELILGYLVDKARTRAAGRAPSDPSSPEGESRTKG